MTIEQKIFKQIQERSAERAAEAARLAESAKIEEVSEKKAGVAFKALAAHEGYITGIGAAAGSPEKLDLDGEFVNKADLMKMAYDFTSAPKRTFKANHKTEIDAKLVQSWVGAPIIEDGDGVRVLKADEKLTPEMNVVGIDIRPGNESHWFVGAKLPEALADKAGEVVGFSFGANVNKVKV